MASLKALKNKVAGIKSTRKITEAMRLVSASKFHRAQMNMSGSAAYFEKMKTLMEAGASSAVEDFEFPLFSGGEGNKTLILMIAGNRGLAGAYNINLVRHLKGVFAELKKEGQEPLLYLVGRKIGQILKPNFGSIILNAEPFSETLEEQEEQSHKVADFILQGIEKGDFSRVILINNRFVNAMVQIPQSLSLVPPFFSKEKQESSRGKEKEESKEESAGQFEPSQKEWLEAFLPVNLQVRIYSALLENSVAVQGARMVAMDGASRNANKLIDSLTLEYNRTRQNNITRELSEIVAGATAVGA